MSDTSTPTAPPAVLRHILVTALLITSWLIAICLLVLLLHDLWLLTGMDTSEHSLVNVLSALLNAGMLLVCVYSAVQIHRLGFRR